MSIFNVSKLAKVSGINRLKLWRWFASRYAVVTEEEKQKVINAIESELKEIKKR